MSRTTPPSSAIQRVPIRETVRAAYRAVFGSLGLLFKAAALPFLLSLAILGLALMAGNSAFLSFILTIVGFVPYTLFGVAWHRLTLLGPVQGAPVAFPTWKPRHWRFLGYVMVITGSVYLLSVLVLAGGLGLDGASLGAGPGPLIVIAGVLAVLIGVPYLLMRIGFVFPAVAVDESYTLRNSWAHTRGQGFRLLATLILTALPMLAVIWVVSWLLGALLLPDIAANSQDAGMSPEDALRRTMQDNAALFALAQLALAALNYTLMALTVSAISIAFRFCTGWVPASNAGPPATQDNGANGAES